MDTWVLWDVFQQWLLKSSMNKISIPAPLKVAANMCLKQTFFPILGFECFDLNRWALNNPDVRKHWSIFRLMYFELTFCFLVLIILLCAYISFTIRWLCSCVHTCVRGKCFESGYTSPPLSIITLSLSSDNNLCSELVYLDKLFNPFWHPILFPCCTVACTEGLTMNRELSLSLKIPCLCSFLSHWNDLSLSSSNLLLFRLSASGFPRTALELWEVPCSWGSSTLQLSPHMRLGYWIKSHHLELRGAWS